MAQTVMRDPDTSNPIRSSGFPWSQIMSPMGTLFSSLGGENYGSNIDPMAAENMRQQREFAQYGIRWRVKDALAAGVHPTVALGGNTGGFSPVASVGQARGMGQNIMRAVLANFTGRERQDAKMRELQLEYQELKNKELAAQITNGASQPKVSNGRVSTRGSRFGQADFTDPQVTVVPVEVPHSRPKTRFAEAGKTPGVRWEKTPDGVVAMPSESIQDAISENIFHKVRHLVKYNLAPNFGSRGSAPSRKELPKWADYWEWNYVGQEWRPAKTRTR